MPVKPNDISLLKFSGADTISFLQGQLTNDLNMLDGRWQFSGYCSPKGRLLALFQLWRENDDIYALIDSSLLESTVKRLRMYIMRSKVTIEVIEQASIRPIFNQEHPQFSITIEAQSRNLHHGTRTLKVSFMTESTMPNATNEHSNNSALNQKDDAWALSCIEAGEPTINSNNVELFVPQMVNLDLLDGINFKKGCYTGQEIVARMHYLGKLKQRMFICDVIHRDTPTPIAGEATPIAGEKVVSFVDGAERNAGNIVSTAAGKALAVLRTEMVNSTLKSESGCELRVSQRQAYEIPASV